VLVPLVVLLNVPVPDVDHVNVDALPPTDPLSANVDPAQIVPSLPAAAVAGGFIVTEDVAEAAEHPPPAAILLVTVYVPGVDADKLI
jgi:hypothetical protein